jgi:hypothetical protein
MCSFNLKANDSKTLADEPGIPELMELYYDDEYDYETGKFKGMKEETKKIFMQNLKNFYNVFTDNINEPLPENIQKFSDIKLRDYKKKPNCQGPSPSYEQPVKGPIDDELFKMYAENLKQMLKKANTNQELLLDVLNKLFVYMTDPHSHKKVIRINPELTEELLQEVVLETRAIIINLYLTCETDYANGIKIYETIVDKKIIDAAKSQIDTMEKTREKIVSDDEIPIPAELSQLTDITSEKIQRQRKNVESETEKIQREETLVETVKSATIKPQVIEPQQVIEQQVIEPQVIKPQQVIEPQVKVQINVQGKGGNSKKTRKNKNKK